MQTFEFVILGVTIGCGIVTLMLVISSLILYIVSFFKKK